MYKPGDRILYKYFDDKYAKEGIIVSKLEYKNIVYYIIIGEDFDPEGNYEDELEVAEEGEIICKESKITKLLYLIED